MKLPETRAARGRPRSFDCEKALDQALQVFWKNGYEGASLADLTQAMGINRPSLYAAFGNKEALFRKALARYMSGSNPDMSEALAAPTARGVVKRFLGALVDCMSDPKKPRGCLVVRSLFSCGEESNVLRDELLSQRAAGFAALRARFKRARAEGDLPPEADPADLARYVSALCYGMALESANGATRAELRRLVELALRNWPA
jgi:AcrR family transcriptional regulator